MKKRPLKIMLFIAISWLCSSCSHSPNDPHAIHSHHQKILYTSFAQQPKTLDPAKSYSSDESLFTGNIYEPPLQYHYIFRPYRLVALTAQSLPKIYFLDKNMNPVNNQNEKNKIAFTVYEIQLKPGIFYQPHPAFTRNKQGQFIYHHLNSNEMDTINSVTDFKSTGTRELTADDYIYEIKRIADPAVQSPILGLMQNYIYGLDQLNARLINFRKNNSEKFLNLNQIVLPGVIKTGKYSYKIMIKGQYSQFLYWLAMPFFAPIPWEADEFYAQKVLKDKNMSLDTYPVGTGAYMMIKNDPNHEMILAKNPNFHQEYFPNEGYSAKDAQDFIRFSGKKLPFIDVVHFSLEKESIPRWNKFLQGYYDQSGIGSDQFDQTIKMNEQGELELSPEMQKKRLSLRTQVSPAIYYMGFNMLDPRVGGYSESAKKLRQAISIAVDFNEFVHVFLNGRGIVAQGPLPPEVFGYSVESLNPYVFELKQNKVERHSIEYAKRLLTEAGYPNGIDPQTGEALILNFDAAAGSHADDKAEFDWYRSQFAKLGIELQIRATQYNQFQKKMMTGNAQIYFWGWNADYPDPENFLFQLYGPNGKVKFGGENASNYNNPEYNKLFEQMRNLPDSPERLAVIKKMLDIVEQDSPWIWGFYPKIYSLSHEWVLPTKPSGIANNTLKYADLDPNLRRKNVFAWNPPLLWPLVGFIFILIILLYLSWLFYQIRMNLKSRRFKISKEDS